MTAQATASTLGVPVFSLDEVRRFNKVATIRDEAGFLAELNKLVREAAEMPERAMNPPDHLRQDLRSKARALQADRPWEPSVTDIQRGRAAMLQEFMQPQNLSLPGFAELAGKSRQQIYKDIAARRLLALDVGTRGRRLPDWQLDPVAHKLTQAVLAAAVDVNAWTLFHVLAEPMRSLRDVAPIKAVRPSSVAEVAAAVLDALGIHASVPDSEHA